MVSSAAFLSPSNRPSMLFKEHSKVQGIGEVDALHRGQVVINTSPHGMTGGAVNAKIYVKAPRNQIWSKLTDYSRWDEYFPNITRSEVLASNQTVHRVYQVGRKACFAIAAEVEIYLKVYEDPFHSIQFRLEKGSFRDFGADLTLQDWQQGTLVTYAVKATPLIPIPGFLIEQGMRMDLPSNMDHMRKMLYR